MKKKIKQDRKNVFVFNTENEDIIKKVISGTIPAGYYSIVEEWRFGKWGKTLYYFDHEQHGRGGEDVIRLGEFQVKDFRLHSVGGLAIYY